MAPIHRHALSLTFALSLLASAASAQRTPDWVRTMPIGNSLSSGFADMVVDAQGISYVTATSGSSSNTDVFTAAFDVHGNPLWSHTFNGPANWHDQARGMALGAPGWLWVTGNTPDPTRRAEMLLLGYDTATGTLRTTTQVPSPSSEAGHAITADALGNVFVAGSTVGDGGDVQIVQFDPQGQLVWRRTWDGSAWAPYSQDIALEIRLDPQGDPLTLIHGVASSNHPDYVVVKYASDGTFQWEANWGVNGGDHPQTMEIDAAGDVFVTGTGINGSDQFSTVKFRGSDGTLLWQEYDTLAFHNSATAMALDPAGDVYVVGRIDPDGDRSNGNWDIFAFKRDGRTGASLWTFRFGDACRGCSDGTSDIAVDTVGNVYLASVSSSPPYASDLVTFVLDASTGTERERWVMPRELRANAGTGKLAFDASFDLWNGASSRDPNTGQVKASLFRHAHPDSYRMDVAPLVGGSTTTFDVHGANPGAFQFLGLALHGTAATPIPALQLTMALRDPVLLFYAPSDPAGRFTVPVPVPPGIAGVDIWFQCLQFREQTPVVQRTFL